MIKKVFLIFLILCISSCNNIGIQGESNNPIHSKEIAIKERGATEGDKENREEKESKIFEIYCNLGKIQELYSLAPKSQMYHNLMKNRSDINSQKGIAPKILAEYSIMGIDSKLKKLNDSDLYADSIRLLNESATKMKMTFENMKTIQSFEDFKVVFSEYATALEILTRIPEKMIQEGSQDVLFMNSNNQEAPFMLCNNNVSIEYWGGEYKEAEENIENSSGEEVVKPRFYKSDIHIGVTTENLNIRDAASTSSKLLGVIPKGSYVVYIPYKTFHNAGHDWFIVGYNEEGIYGFAVTGYIKYVQPLPENYESNSIDNTPTYNTPTYNNQSQYFHGYKCTSDCSGHEAGYYWAERNGIDNIYDCSGNSQSFIEGCQSYVEENY